MPISNDAVFESVAVRVRDVKRMDIPYSFDVMAYYAPCQDGRTRAVLICQPKAPIPPSVLRDIADTAKGVLPDDTLIADVLVCPTHEMRLAPILRPTVIPVDRVVDTVAAILD